MIDTHNRKTKPDIMNTPIYKNKLFSIFVFSLLLTTALYPSSVYSQNNKSTIIDNPIISDQAASDSAAIILSNIKLIADINEGQKLEYVPTTSTIIADTEAALAVLRTYQNYKIEATQSILTDLHLSLKSIKVKLAYANKVGNNSYITELTKLEDDAVAKITAAKAQLVSSKVAATNVSNGLKVLKGLGIGLSVVGTAIEGKTALEELKKDAASLQSTLSQAKFVFSAASTSLVIVGAKLAPQVALVQVATDVTVAYIDFLGDAVHTESQKRIEAIYSAINTAHIQVKNRIKSHYLAGKKLTDEEASAIAALEYQKVKDFILQFKDDVGIMEWLYGINKSDKKAINDAIYQVDFLLDGKAKDRAIEFNDEIRDIFEDNARLSAIIDKSVASLNLENLTISSSNFGPLASTDCTTVPCTFTPDPNTNANEDDKDNLGTTPPTLPVTSSGVWFGQLTGLGAKSDLSTYSDNIGVWSGGDTSQTNKAIKGNLPISIVDYMEPGDTQAFTSNQVIVTEKDYFAPDSFSNLNDTADGTYKYAAWGRWNSPSNDPVELNGFTIRNGYWVIGDQTKSSTIAARTGKAFYEGAVIADYVQEGTSQVRYGVVNGRIAMTADFENNSLLTGGIDLNINLAGTNEDWVSTSIYDGKINDGFTQPDGSLAGPYVTGGFAGFDGEFTGFFYGPNGDELAGSLYVQRDVGDVLDGHAQGVFRTHCVVTANTQC